MNKKQGIFLGLLFLGLFVWGLLAKVLSFSFLTQLVVDGILYVVAVFVSLKFNWDSDKFSSLARIVILTGWLAFSLAASGQFRVAEYILYVCFASGALLIITAAVVEIVRDEKKRRTEGEDNGEEDDNE